jgi:hypothetical protein
MLSLLGLLGKFTRRLTLTGVGVEKVGTNQLVFMKTVWDCEAFRSIV